MKNNSSLVHGCVADDCSEELILPQSTNLWLMLEYGSYIPFIAVFFATTILLAFISFFQLFFGLYSTMGIITQLLVMVITICMAIPFFNIYRKIQKSKRGEDGYGCYVKLKKSSVAIRQPELSGDADSKSLKYTFKERIIPYDSIIGVVNGQQAGDELACVIISYVYSCDGSTKEDSVIVTSKLYADDLLHKIRMSLDRKVLQVRAMQ